MQVGVHQVASKCVHEHSIIAAIGLNKTRVQQAYSLLVGCREAIGGHVLLINDVNVWIM